MVEIAQMAATEWARAHAGRCSEPEEFGRKVAQVSRAALSELRRVDLSADRIAPSETLQSSSRSSEHLPLRTKGLIPADSAGESGGS